MNQTPVQTETIGNDYRTLNEPPLENNHGQATVKNLYPHR
jgi:hypothetical protein